ncbi:hypothetical protein Q1695_014042 [Nippostrongylus brasiliensis]|nr:hypothetical protein Q1695_014042 [Nippostrongylus brasiliensis]
MLYVNYTEFYTCLIYSILAPFIFPFIICCGSSGERKKGLLRDSKESSKKGDAAGKTGPNEKKSTEGTPKFPHKKFLDKISQSKTTSDEKNKPDGAPDSFAAVLPQKRNAKRSEAIGKRTVEKKNEDYATLKMDPSLQENFEPAAATMPTQTENRANSPACQ